MIIGAIGLDPKFPLVKTFSFILLTEEGVGWPD